MIGESDTCRFARIIGASSDFVLEKIEDIAAIKDKILSTPVKDITVIDAAIARREKM